MQGKTDAKLFNPNTRSNPEKRMAIKSIIKVNIEKVRGIDVNNSMVGVIEMKKSIQRLLNQMCDEQLKFFKKQKIEATMRGKVK